MNRPEVFLSSIVRGDGVYIQAFIFSVRNGYIHSKSVKLTNLTDNTYVTYELEEGDNVTCLFKFIQKLNLSLSSNFKVELITRVYSYDSNSIVEYVDEKTFATPAEWVSGNEIAYSIFLKSLLGIGRTSMEPTLKAIISGGPYSVGMTLRICGSNLLSNIIAYNSFDIKSDIEVEENVYVYEKMLRLNLSGNWYFKAFLTLQNGTIISQSDTIIHNVSQGDLNIVSLGENVVKEEQGGEYRLNQLIDGKRVGITTLNLDRTIQTGSYYEFHDNSGAWYFDMINNLEVGHRLPSMEELFAYIAIKPDLIGVKPKAYYSNEVDLETNSIKILNFDSGVPGTAGPGDNNVGYMLLEDFVNKISDAESLEIPVMKSGAKLQASGYKITDLLTKQESKTLVTQIQDLSLMEVTYAELAGIISRQELVPYKRYLIKDYQTVHSIPNTTDINTGDVEPLMVTALSADRLDAIAYSSLYPQDTIYYEVENNQAIVPGCTKGYIYRRIDEMQNNDFPMDFRNVKFRRWEIAQPAWNVSNVPYTKGVIVSNPASSALYISLVDGNDEDPTNVGSTTWEMLPYENETYLSPFPNEWKIVDAQKGVLYSHANYFQDYHIYADVANYSMWHNNKIEKSVSSIIENCNTVVLNMFSDNRIGYAFSNNTIFDFLQNDVKDNFSGNLINSGFSMNNIDKEFKNNLIFTAFTSNRIGRGFNCNIALNNFEYNNLGRNIYENFFGRDFNSNTIGNHFEYNTVRNNFVNNDAKDLVTGVDFTEIAIVYSDFYKEIFKKQGDGFVIRYIDATNQLVITPIV